MKQHMNEAPLDIRVSFFTIRCALRRTDDSTLEAKAKVRMTEAQKKKKKGGAMVGANATSMAASSRRNEPADGPPATAAAAEAISGFFSGLIFRSSPLLR
jgi:hypothetical protein